MIPTKQANIVLVEDPAENENANSELTYAELKGALKDLNMFSKATSMKVLKEDLLIQKRTAKFKAQIGTVLRSVEQLPNDPDKLQKIFLLVMQYVSDRIYCKDQEKCNKYREELCVDVLNVFTHGDRQLCLQTMRMCTSKVKPSTFLRRNKNTITKVFFCVLEKLFMAK